MPARRRFFSFLLAISLLILLGTSASRAQSRTRRVLFLGNSYTAFNNLPEMVASVAEAFGDTLVFQDFHPGGQFLQAHADDASVQAAIQQGGWDYIVMQEQSQIPTIPFFRQDLFMPGSADLRQQRDQHAPCARLLYFLTWGRENGGQQCNSGFCSVNFTNFGHYQDTLTWAYQRAADQNGAGIAPVGETWRAAQQAHDASLPALNLFASDGSHPSLQGSYLAALSIYSAVFRRPVDRPSAFNPGLDSSLAAFFRSVVDSTVWPRRTEWRLRDTSSAITRLGWAASATSWSWGHSLTSDSLRLQTAGLAPGLAVRWELASGDTLPGTSAGLALDSLSIAPGDTLAYTLRLTDGCDTLRFDSSLVMPEPTARPRQQGRESWHIGPNPVQDALFLQPPAAVRGRVKLHVLDASGRTVLTTQAQIRPAESSIRLDLAELPAGLYHLRIFSEELPPRHRRLLKR